jgi:transposase InsO family protein
MVRPAAKRASVAHLQAVMGLSERRACRIVEADRTMIRYQSSRAPDTALRTQLRDLANERRPRSKISAWADDYNERRPHSSLGYVPPAVYAANLTATCDRLRNPDQLRRSHVAPPAPTGVKPFEALTATG